MAQKLIKYSQKLVLLLCILFPAKMMLAEVSVKIDSLEKRLETAIHDTERVNVLNKLAQHYQAKDTARALQYANESISLAENIPFNKGLAKAYINQAKIFVYQGLHNRARPLLNDAVKLANTINNSEIAGLGYLSIAKTYYATGLYDNALEYLDSAWSYLSKPGNLYSCHNRYAICYYYLGKYEKAMKSQMKALEIAETLNNDVKIASILNNIGISHVRLQNYDLALNYFKRSLAITEKIGSSENMLANKYNNIALVHAKLKKYREAIPYYEKAIELSRQANNPRSTGRSLANIASVYTKLQQYEMAFTYLKQALTIMKAINDKHNLVAIYQQFGKNYAKLGNLSKGNYYAQKALKLSVDIKAPAKTVDAYETLTIIAVEASDYKKAYQYLTLSSNIKDSLFSKEKAEAILNLEAKYESEKKEREIAEQNEQIALNKIAMAQKDARIQTQDRQRNAMIAIICVILVVILLAFRNFRNKRIAELEKATNQIKIHLNEVQLLKLMLNLDKKNNTKNLDRDYASVNMEDLSNYMLHPLSSREYEVLLHLTDGLTNKQISAELSVSTNTVKTHIMNIYDKLDVQNRIMAVKKASELNLIQASSGSF